MSQKVNLQERVLDVGQPVSGLSVCAEKDGYGTPAVVSSQRWMFWKVSTIGWVLQAVGGSGGLLDYSGENQIIFKSSLAA